MKAKDLARARKIKHAVNGGILWMKIVLFAVLISFIIMGVSHARPSVRYGHYTSVNVTHVHHHSRGYEVVPLVLAGVIAGLVIYDIANKPCNHGVACIRF